MSANTIRGGIAAAILLATTSLVVAHGDVAPQPVNTDALPEVGEEWLTENPYREAKAGHETWLKAVEIGASGFNQNCARCHGLGAVSGGIAPDLRQLDIEPETDEFFIGRVRNGVTRNGAVYMPPFEGTLSQEAMWAIRAWLETVREK